MRSLIHRTTFAALICTAAACASDSEQPPPRDRLGAPLAVTPARTPSSDSGASPDGATSEATTREAGRDGGGESDAPAATAQPSPQPARALAVAVEADRLGAAGELEQAMATYERALELNPNSPWLRTAHAWYLSRSGQQAAARDDLERALDNADQRDPLLVGALQLGLGELREARGDQARARESYRIALRTWSRPPLARALLRLTPTTDLQWGEIARLAFGDRELPAELGRAAPRPGAAEALDFIDIEGLGLVTVIAQPPPGTGGLLAPGAQYALHLTTRSAQPDAGAAQPWTQLPLVEVPVVRWHEARMQPATLAGGHRGVLIHLERTSPGAGAPLEVGTTLLDLDPTGGPQILFTRVTGSERDDPLGCRRGWRERVSLHDRDGDGDADEVRLQRSDFVRPRLESAESFCTARERSRPEQVVQLRASGSPADEGEEPRREGGAE